MERNLFRSFPNGLTTLNQTNHPNLITLTLGLEFRDPYWHFNRLPSNWVANLPSSLSELRLNYIQLTDAEADFFGHPVD